MVDVLFIVRLRLLFAVALLSVLFSILVPSAAGVSRQEAAVSTVSEAEQFIVQAYEAVVGAESAGAHVSSLLVGLNDAVGLLSEAQVALEVGDFEECIRLAELSREAGSGVGNAARALEVEANYAHANLSWWFAGGSVLGVSIVVLTSFFGYRYFKRRYYKRLLKIKPRVGQA